MSENVTVIEQIVNLEIADNNGIVEIISSPVIEFRLSNNVIEIHVVEILNTVEVTQEEIIVEIATNISTGGVWSKNDQTISANAIKDVDQNNLNNFTGISYIVSLWNDDKSLSRKFNLSVTKEDGILSSVLYSIHGSLTGVKVTDDIVGDTGKLIIENTNNFLLNYSIAKLIQ